MTGTNSVRNAGPVFEREPGYNPERALWQSVLLLAIEEALNGVNGNGNIPQAKRELLIERTRAYLTRPSHDLALVCSGAGIDMKALIERMRGRIASAPGPAELAVGKRVSKRNISQSETPLESMPVQTLMVDLDSAAYAHADQL